MGVWRVEDEPKADRVVQLIGDVSSQTSLGESVLILEGSTRSQASKMCHEQKSPPGPPPHPRPCEATTARYDELSVFSGVLAGQSEPSWRVRANNSLIAPPKPACVDHVWESTAVHALSDDFPPKICSRLRGDVTKYLQTFWGANASRTQGCVQCSVGVNVDVQENILARVQHSYRSEQMEIRLLWNRLSWQHKHHNSFSESTPYHTHLNCVGNYFKTDLWDTWTYIVLILLYTNIILFYEELYIIMTIKHIFLRITNNVKSKNALNDDYCKTGKCAQLSWK